MLARIAINGFGRIGRAFFKAAFGQPELEFIAINDLGDPDMLAYLLRFDSVYGRWDKQIKIIREGKQIFLGISGKRILFLQEQDPFKLPWKSLNIDIAVEATGMFETYEKARAHVHSGAKKVVLTAPAKDEDTDGAKTVLLGVNEQDLKTCTISSNGSCTTNSAHPVIQILSETLGLKKAYLVSTHGYTATQNLVDGPTKSKDFRRGRAGAVNIVPTTTGAAIAVTRAVKSMHSKFDGLAFRVPIVTGSISAITALVQRPTTKEEVNDIFKKAAADPHWDNILTTIEEPIVSSDIIGQSYGAIIDLGLTAVTDGDLVTVYSWYDNEAGYTATLLKHVLKVAEYLQI